MPARNQVVIRPKLFHSASAPLGLAPADKKVPQHGHAAEYGLGIVSIVVNAMFVVGSIAFLDGFPTWVAAMGDWLFIIGSVVTFIMAGWSAHEAWETWGHPDLNDDTSLIAQACKAERLQDEVLENLNFVVASAVFLVGCLFFMPGAYADEVAEEYGHSTGAWCFIVGSFGFVLASYWNACGMAAQYGQQYRPGSRQARCLRLTSISLCLAMLGGVFFVTGSFLYRPGYTSECNTGLEGGGASLLEDAMGQDVALPSAVQRHAAFHGHRVHRKHHGSFNFLQMRSLVGSTSTEAAEADPSGADANPLCSSAAADGTVLYIIGSCLFLAQSIISMACTVIMSSETPLADDLLPAIDGRGAAGASKKK